MGKSATKVVYKPDPNASDVFLVLVNPYKKWKGGDRTIPLVEVVDSFEIFSSNQGPQGLLCRPSKQQLDTVFNTHADDDVIQQILDKGKVEASENLASEKWGSKNDSKGSALDTRGGGSTRGI
ncbi:ribosome maturation protein [Lactarius hengduanensis]|nr:ribosome maturation protein [Lactarius hengduanensis]